MEFWRYDCDDGVGGVGAPRHAAMKNGHENNLEGLTLLDKYRLVKLLGRGGMGAVYQAEQLGLGRSVAIKVIHTREMSGVFDAFKTEALAASRINHPNAVAIYDFGITDDNMPFLVMEHLRGQSLGQLIREQSLSTDRIITLGAQILSALSEAHACGVIHCDLTSENVVVERMRDGGDFAKVIDFGLARLFDRPKGNTIVGTPEYMAPEQIRGQTLGPSADLYAAGIVLYEMIVRRTPFAGGTINEVVKAHIEKAPPAPCELASDCPDKLNDVVLWALGKTPDHRPASAQIMREALLSAVGDGGTLVRCRRCGDGVAPQQNYCAGCGFDMRATVATIVGATRSDPGSLARGTRSVTPAPDTSQTQIDGKAWHSTRLTCKFGSQPVGLVGRHDELNQLLRFCRGETPTHTMAIVGPPGIGKARLVFEASQTLAGLIPLYTAAPDPSGLKSPWYPVLSMLESVFEHHGEMTLASLKEATQKAGLPEREIPGLAEVFGLLGPANELELAVRRREAHAAALRAILSLVQRAGNVVICFANIDDYDEPSRVLVQALSTALEDTDMRLIVTALGEVVLPPTSNVLHLEGLAPRETSELASELVANSHIELPEPAALQALTSGLPVAVEQVAGWLDMGNRMANVPPLLVDLVAMRVNRMSQQSRRVLQAAAIHGNVVSRWLVEATLGVNEQEREAFEPSLLEVPGLLVYKNDEFTIPSEMAANVICACTPADVRRSLHKRALAALVSKAIPGVLGHHAEHAGEFETAYRYFVQAGQDAEHRFDDNGAATFYSRALAVARRSHALGDADAGGHFVDGAVLLANVLRYRGHTGLALGVLEEAELFGLRREQRPEIERTRARIYLASGDAKRALESIQRALGLILPVGDLEFLCDAYIDLADVYEQLCDHSSAVRELEQAVDIITLGEGIPSQNAPSNLWYLGMLLAERYLYAKEIDLSLKTALSALELAKWQQSARGRARLSALLAQIFSIVGEPKTALRYRVAAIDELSQLGDRRSTAQLLMDSATLTRPTTDGEQARTASDTIRDGRNYALAAELATEIGWQPRPAGRKTLRRHYVRDFE